MLRVAESLLSLVLLLLLVAPLSCKSGERSINTAEDFLYVSGKNNRIRMIDYIMIDSAGKGVHVYVADFTSPDAAEKYNRSSFSLGTEQVQQLKRAIDQAQVFKMKSEYHNKDILDGTQRYLMVTAHGKTKMVYFNNAFPPGARRVFRVQDSVLKNIDIRGSATVVSKEYLEKTMPFKKYWSLEKYFGE